jgi:hypothetical protein
MAYNKYMLRVKIRKVTGNVWYKKGQEHIVLPTITRQFKKDGTPFFEKSKGFYGIRCSDCNILETICINQKAK